MGDAPRVRVPAAIQEAVGALLEDRDRAMLARLAEMEDESSRSAKILSMLLGHLHLRAGDQDVPDDVKEPVDKVWSCRKCGVKLGFYDEASDVLRVRNKDLIVHMHTGVGGWVRVVCRGCGEFNVLEYAPTPFETATMPEVTVAGDVLLLDPELLAALAGLVQKADAGVVKVRLVQAPAPSPE